MESWDSQSPDFIQATNLLFAYGPVVYSQAGNATKISDITGDDTVISREKAMAAIRKSMTPIRIRRSRVTALPCGTCVRVSRSRQNQDRL